MHTGVGECVVDCVDHVWLLHDWMILAALDQDWMMKDMQILLVFRDMLASDFVVEGIKYSFIYVVVVCTNLAPAFGT